MNKKVRLIAFYLPQYHEIPENNLWFGKGFTEWTNVKKAKKLFRDHYQPHIPTDLGYYNLHNPEIRKLQTKIAREHGIEGFCYWHYWFAGKRLLEKPFQDVIESNEPDFPFCLGWANDSWTGIWHGAPGRILIEQTYPGEEDEYNHFYSVLPAFRDKRYLTVNGKPIFYIYKPKLLKNAKKFITHWNKLARKEGLNGIYFIANIDDQEPLFEESVGFSAVTPHNPGWTLYHCLNLTKTLSYNVNRLLLKLMQKSLKDYFRPVCKPYIFDYEEYIKYALPIIKTSLDVYPCVVPNWDNTPRCGINGVVLKNSTPFLFGTHLEDAIKCVNSHEEEKGIIFLKSWNEWAEGNYLEPDNNFWYEYLQVCREKINNTAYAREKEITDSSLA